MHTSLRPSRRRGMTTIEMLMGLAITGVVGLGIASMLLAVGNGSAERNDLRSVVARQKILSKRLGDAISGSRSLLAQGTDHLVLWVNDDRANDKPNLSELRRIEWSTATGEIWSYRGTLPANWTETQKAAADTAYTLSDNFSTITQGLKSGSYFPGEKWSTGLASFTATLNAVSPQTATLVSYRAVLTAGSVTNTSAAIGAAALRQ